MSHASCTFQGKKLKASWKTKIHDCHHITLQKCKFMLKCSIVYWADGFWITIIRYSLSGAIMISCFFERTLRNVKSFCGSMSRTVLRALDVSEWINPAYWTVVELSKVVLMGIPSLLTMIIPITPLWPWILFSNSSTSD